MAIKNWIKLQGKNVWRYKKDRLTVVGFKRKGSRVRLWIYNPEENDIHTKFFNTSNAALNYAKKFMSEK